MTHEQLQSYQSKDAQAKNGENHHVGQLLHGLEQSTDDGFQTCESHDLSSLTVLIKDALFETLIYFIGNS